MEEIRENCLHVALVGNKNRLRIAYERIDADHGDVRGL